MKRTLIAASLIAIMSVPAHAQDKMGADPICAEFTAMDSAGQMKAMEMMGSNDDKMAMSKDKMMEEGKDKMGVDGSHLMSPGEKMASAVDACKTHPDGTVGDAINMMKGS